jgi:hypothetical protein
MRDLSPAELLDIWDRGQGRHPVDRALLLLAAARNGDGGEPDALPLGEANRRLLELRARAFGPRLEVRVDCPACGERLELSLETADLASPAPPPPDPSSDVLLERDGWRVAFRLLTPADLRAAAARGGEDAVRAALVRLSVREAARDGEAVDPAALPDDVLAAVGARLLESDPLAEMLLEMACPACATTWEAPLEPADFLWAELEAEASRLLREVHALASAYGWTEPQVLALPPQRRRAYLEMVGA